MKKIYAIYLLLIFWLSSINAQYIPTTEDFLVNDVIPPYQANSGSRLKSGTTYDFYNDFRNWIPYCTTDPLKNPPITYIEITFHIFLDNNGQNNYLNTQEGRDRLLYLFNLVNSIYSGGWGPSDPVSGVVELPNYDTRIRFTLGENNERIYFYYNTSLNHDWSSSNYYSYILNNYPSRASKLNVYFTAGHLEGKVEQSNITITNGGSGYTSAPTVTFNPSGATGTALIQYGHITGINITNKGAYNGFDPPQITFSGGGGTGASAIVTKLSGGGTGYSTMPSTYLPQNHFVVMLHCYEAYDWVYGFCLAHELGHDLDLLHTYCFGGASAIICISYCSLSCDGWSCDDNEYLSDIFGTCPGTYHHLNNFVDPYDNTIPDAEKITNNLMGGSNTAVYLSPMQAGQIYRALALKSVRKYVKAETYSPLPLVLNSSETWDFNLKLYRDINISSGSILTISNTFELPYKGTITINNGTALVITGNLVLNDNNKVIVKNGGTIKFSAASNVTINGSGKIEVQSGGYFCVESGSTVTLSNFNSVINLRNGYINGVNTSVIPSSNCVSSPASYTINGSGKINLFNQNIYVQNETISTCKYYAGNYINIGNNVTPSKPQGNVLINNNSVVIFDADQDVLFDKGFEISLGSSFEVPTK